jgi:RNA polymerase sigma-70 factor (ECF subfamily)
VNPAKPSHDPSDEEADYQADGPLVQACQLGDRDAQRRLYEKYGEKIFRLMVRMAGTQDAADLAQQVFLQVYRKIHQFSGKSKFGTWLYRVAVNEALQHRRRCQSRQSQSLHFDPVSEANDSDAVEKRESLEYALATIEPELRTVFLLREVEQLSYAQLAEVLDVPAGTIASRLNRARRELKASLEVL